MAHYLGLELATEHVRATVVDEGLDIVFSAAVEFDTDLPEFQTRGGLFTAPGDVCTTSVEMWLKALDILLSKLKTGVDLARIRAVGGCAQHAAVWCTAAAKSHMSGLDHTKTLHAQLGSPSTLALVHTPVTQDTSTASQARTIETALGGPDALAQRLGTATPTTAAQAIKIREGNPDAWTHTSHVVLASAFLASLFVGDWAPATEAEAVATGFWNVERGGWDEEVLELAGGGSKEEGQRLKEMLGGVCPSGTTTVGTISTYFCQRYGFSPETPVAPFTSDHLATYLSLSACLSSSPSQVTPDAILAFGPTDVLLSPVPSSAPSPPPRSRHYTLLPHPCTPKSYITVLASRNGDVPRALVRDMYTKSWAAFDRLVSVVPPGGAIGLDDKLFSFWLLQPEGPPFEHVKGIYRFETGVKVNEFRDLRANPRQHARMTSLLTSTPTPNRPTSLLATSLSTIFDPYTSSALPSRILALGAAAGFASVASITADVFGARVLVPRSVITRGAPVTPLMTPTRGAGILGFPSGGGSGTSTPGLVVPGQQPQSQQQQQPAPDTRAALGAAYLARWSVLSTGTDFEDDVRTVIRKRAKLSGALGLGVPVGTYGRSGLGASVLVEEDEEEKEDENGDMHERTNTNSTTATSLSLHLSLPPQQPPNAANPTTTSASVHALPTDESDALLGLAKVAEGDMDAFSAYAALIPEWCRLEGMLVRGVV
ncbi:xylulokinase, partial [Rhizoctonia solani]